MLTAGTATAACGPIGFVGLVIPHMVRKFTGPAHRWLLPYSMILAPILLLGSDIIGRVIARPSEVQVGIVTALVGAPFFVAVAAPSHTADSVVRRHVVRIGPVSARLDVRSIAVSAALTGAVFVLFCWTISVGDFPIPIREVIVTLLGGGSEDSRFVVGELRLPRALVGALVGAAFGLSGAILQILARNPLASPDIIGVTHGASFAAVAVIVLGGSGDLLGGVASIGVPIAALLGGLAAALLVYVLSYRRGLVGYRLVLIGIGDRCRHDCRPFSTCSLGRRSSKPRVRWSG